MLKLSSSTKSLILVGCGLGALCGLSYYCYCVNQSNSNQVSERKARAKKLSPVRIKDIFVYPISSCRGFFVPRWPLGECGSLLLDREFMCISVAADGTANGTANKVTSEPKQCAIWTRIAMKGDSKSIDFSESSGSLARLASSPEDFELVCEVNFSSPIFSVEDRSQLPQEPLRISLTRGQASSGQRKLFSVERSGAVMVDGECQGDEAAAWFSAVLGKGVRLLRASASKDKLRRPPPNQGSGADLTRDRIGGFAPYGHMHVASAKSIDSLAAAVRSSNDKRLLELPNFTGERFRANLVVDSPELEPWTEEEWAELDLRAATGGIVHCRHARHTCRCAVPTRDPATGCRLDHTFEPVTSMRKAPSPHELAAFRLQRLQAAEKDGQTAVEKPAAKPMFGVEIFCDVEMHEEARVLSVGDSVVVPTQLKPPLEVE